MHQGTISLDNAETPKLLCFCHLRWDFVYQRPQHLLSRCQRITPVYLWEDPIFTDDPSAPRLEVVTHVEGVVVARPLLPHGRSHEEHSEMQRELLNGFLAQHRITDFIAWYYTPMALYFSDHLKPRITIYDCMDELSAFDGAPPELVEKESRLFEQSDVVFCGGASLYRSKQTRHANVHLFPSSIDFDHFAQARSAASDPADQVGIAHPRIGFYGVLDERLDRDLLREAAALRPDWNFVLIGPVVKIREEDLPRGSNIHYLGQKSYGELPQYLAGWDVAMLPFARNRSTEFISPTKTPEYLAAGRPVVSTPIRDVAAIYGEAGLVRIGATPQEFVDAIEASLAGISREEAQRRDDFLAGTSWDQTFQGMWTQIVRCLASAQHIESEWRANV